MKNTRNKYDIQSYYIYGQLPFVMVFLSINIIVVGMGCGRQEPAGNAYSKNMISLSDILISSEPIVYSYLPSRSSKSCSTVQTAPANNINIRHVILEPKQERYCSLLYLLDNARIVPSDSCPYEYPPAFKIITSVEQPDERFSILEQQQQPNGNLKIGMWPSGFLIIQYPDGHVVHAHSETDFWRILTFARLAESCATSKPSG